MHTARSTVLTLSQVAGEQENVQKFSEWLARNNPEMQVLLIGVSEQLWPTIAKLSQESRDHWIHAAFELHSLNRLPAAERIAANSAIKDYGWILEHELKILLFSKFREKVGNDHRLKEQVGAEAYNNMSDKFLKFLVAKNPEISLGIMLGALEDCRNSRLQTDLEFANFVESRFPRLLFGLRDIKLVNDHRDRVSHPTQVFDRAAALKVGSACRNSLDSLFGNDPSL